MSSNAKHQVQCACEDYLGKHHDSGVLLAAIAGIISEETIEDLSSALLQHEPILREVGWDLLQMVTPHLTVPSSSCFTLVSAIVKLSSPKEMSLALLEQIEQSSSPAMLVILMPLLQTVLLQVHPPSIVSSSLSSLHSQMQRHLSAIEQPPGEAGDREAQNGSPPLSTEPLHLIKHCVEFLSPFTSQIDQTFLANNGTGSWRGWSPCQYRCVAILLTLLEHSITCGEEEWVGRVMEEIAHCHCGCLSLLEWSNTRRRRKKRIREEDEDEEDSKELSELGRAIFCNQLLAQDCQHSYLPSVISPGHLLTVGAQHSLVLLQQSSEKQLIGRGLSLLEGLLVRVSTGSLSHLLLEGKAIQRTTEALCNVMVTSPDKKLRQRAVQCLPTLIAVFSQHGRYQFLLQLLHTVSHPGVQGLLVQSVREEVRTALDSEEPGSHFLSPHLTALTRLFLVANPNEDIMRVFDRIMAALNFLRYTLLKDKFSVDRTGIWQHIGSVQEQFITPLRAAITTTQRYCHSRLTSDLHTKQEITDHHDNPEVKVTVEGRALPDITPEQEKEVLLVTMTRLDLVTSVLVRVEDIINEKRLT